MQLRQSVPQSPKQNPKQNPSQSLLILGSNPLEVVDRLFLQIVVDLAVVLAHMLRIPPITAAQILSRHWVERECRSCTFQGNVAVAHDGLSDVLKAVVDVPRHLDGGRVARELQGVVGVEDGVDAVELVRH